MSTHRQIDRICIGGLLLSLLLTFLFVNGEAFGLKAASRVMGYEDRLFDATQVHRIEIAMDDWSAFLETCENEEYAPCTVVIDGESCQNVGLRAKGNTSLTTVSAMGSSRYSFKIEFDQYDSGKSYHGLDKLCLNNIIQDNTYMKDYLTYRLMEQFGVDAPLCSFVYITVNGQDWGLYLAVEGLEEGFLQRSYGRQAGELYKPDSMSFGAGRGNGMDFRMDSVDADRQKNLTPRAGGRTDLAGGKGFAKPPSGGEFSGMGSADVKLQYIDDDPDSYANIFDNAKTDVSRADQERLIQALRSLSTGDVEQALDVDKVLRYFAVHNFVVNGDSYTGSMIHNYYLYEQDGLLSMLPWDYNLAFGTFQSQDAGSAVNDPIDTPLSVTGSGDRPMIDWIFSSETYTQLYHQYFAELLETTDPGSLIDEAYELISSYVERDPTKFCTYEEFEAGVSALKVFCQLRAESISGQLAGTIPSTSQGQSAQPESLVDSSGLDLADMGTMGFGGPAGGAMDLERPEDFPDGLQKGEFSAAPDGTPPAEQSGAQFQFQGVPAGFPGENVPNEPPLPGEEAASSLNYASIALLAGSFVILLLGLLAAFRFRRFGPRG